MKQLLLLLIVLVNCTITQAQPDIRFINTDYNMGTISPGNIPPAVYKFINTGNKPLAILTVQADYEVKYNFSRNYIQAGDTGRIIVSYESARLGDFSKIISVNSNASNQAIALNLAGKVGSAIECMPNRQNQNIREILVIDKETKEPISNARCSMIYNGSDRLQATTNRNGKAQPEMRIGAYDFAISAQGYRSTEDNRFVTRSSSLLLFELEPLPQQTTLAQVPTPVTAQQTTPQPRPTPIPSPELRPDTSKNMPAQLYNPNNIVFLVDVSLSMKQDNKMTKLKKAMKELTNILRPIDKLCLIAYNNSAIVILPAISGKETDSISAAIDSLTPKGLTNGVQGLTLAYEYANKNFLPNGNNEVILATDGEFTGSDQSEPAMINQITLNADKHIWLSIVGFGFDSESINRLQKMAKHGNGEYLHIYDNQNNTRILIDNIKAHSFKGKNQKKQFLK